MKIKKILAWSYFTLITIVFFLRGISAISFPYTLKNSFGLTFTSLISFIPTTPLGLVVVFILVYSLMITFKEIKK